MLRITFNLTW